MSAIHVLKVLVELDHDDALPEDKCVNTFHFDPGDATIDAALLTEIDLLINDFYTVAATGSSTVLSSLLSSNLSGVWRWKIYDLFDAVPRTPLRVTTPAAFGPGSSAMPAEVAVCLSYAAPQISGVNQAHRRGRLFIGPLSSSALSTSTGRPVTSANGIVDTIAAVGQRLAAYGATHDLSWCVYSPTIDAVATVDHGWVDNAFDTQRKRGEAPTARQLWP